ncbi:MAG: hypothetical protein L6243_02780 [Candidatus Altiarchaeales archaeon]|nr:hypothetical protein [Candidatus Altiarchaeota archaeon]MBU4341246.1 hypothetical protein [Candidatus Altiarchaeota archaeon]MCG2782491.1 hypothetical protein [Candidatus Altiarchaeales archaeon]
MVFLLDDLADLTGVILLGQPWSQFFQKIHDTAKQEMYNIDEINNKIKTNRMLYEYGEIPTEEYEKINARLREDRKIALKVRGMDVESG